jgi:Plasmid pRiA4b ORF-3-like protein
VSAAISRALVRAVSGAQQHSRNRSAVTRCAGRLAQPNYLKDTGDNDRLRKRASYFRVTLRTSSSAPSEDDMTQSDTLIIRAALDGKRSIYRDIEIDASKSLYRLAEAINFAFNFDFDHAFGFYSGLTAATMMTVRPIYELFADMGEADRGVQSVKKTKIAQAFPAIGHTMLFLFDYGDEWLFRVTLKGIGKKTAKVRYPHVMKSRGEAPSQYPAADDEADDAEGPTYAINLATGEKIKLGG